MNKAGAVSGSWLGSRPADLAGGWRSHPAEPCGAFMGDVPVRHEILLGKLPLFWPADATVASLLVGVVMSSWHEGEWFYERGRCVMMRGVCLVAAMMMVASDSHGALVVSSQTGTLRSVADASDLSLAAPGAPWNTVLIASDDVDGMFSQSSIETSITPQQITVLGQLVVSRGLTVPGGQSVGFASFSSLVTFDITALGLFQANFATSAGTGTNVNDSAFGRLVRLSDNAVLHTDGIAELLLAPGSYRLEIGGVLGNDQPNTTVEDDSRDEFVTLTLVPAPGVAAIGLAGLALAGRRLRCTHGCV